MRPTARVSSPSWAGTDRSCGSDARGNAPVLPHRHPAGRRLTLSYPAVDGKGQDLLPSSFLAALLDCFKAECFSADAGRTTKQRMLIEGYDRHMPLSPAEYRIQLALTSRDRKGAKGPLPDGRGSLQDNLTAAARLVRQRIDDNDFGPYDGRLRDPAVLDEMAKRFRPERKFSPTALETYIACPFQFFLRNVLRLELLEEPSEEIEQTRRGSAFHLALSRLHQKLRGDGEHGPTEKVGEEMLAQLGQTIREYADRAPSPASKVLWGLEGQRLEKAAARYRKHWQAFVAPWTEHRIAPRPEHFEASFGLPDQPLTINVDGVKVRIGGRIDRVDVAELEDGLGFWIIDYKTGKSTHYTGTDLAEFRRLQLPLYALAVEEVILKGKATRPLGLAYWLVTDTGPKTVMPSSRQPLRWLGDVDAWPRFREQLRRWVATLVKHIRQGDFPLKPRSPDCTEMCDFSQICRIGQSRKAVEKKAWTLELPVMDW